MDTKPKNYGGPSRESGFTTAAKLFKDNGGKVIVETGCYWLEAQGQSTLHLAELAQECDGEFLSVDRNPEHVQISAALVSHIPQAQVHCSDSLEWLGRFPSWKKIDLLYLDAFDYDEKHPDILGIFNVAELGACLGRMNEHSVILLDDWNHGEGVYIKPRLSRELLLYRGWKLIQEDYQLLFAR